MSNPLKVKVLKKSKNAPYPEHIIVDRSATHEMVHMYFDKGKLSKLTHIKKDPQIKMAWDEQEKRYKVLPPSYIIAQEFTIKNCNIHCSKGPEDQNFFHFFDTPYWDSTSIAFQSFPESSPDFFIETDLNLACKPNAYMRDFYGITDIKEIYPHQERRIAPSKKFLKPKER